MADFFLELMAKDGLVRVVADDGSVWWVPPAAASDRRAVTKVLPDPERDAVFARLKAQLPG